MGMMLADSGKFSYGSDFIFSGWNASSISDCFSEDQSNRGFRGSTRILAPHNPLVPYLELNNLRMISVANYSIQISYM